MGDPRLEAGVYAYMSMMADLVVVVVFVNQVRPHLHLLWLRLLWLHYLLWLYLLWQLLTEYSVDPSGLSLDEVDEAGVEEVGLRAFLTLIPTLTLTLTLTLPLPLTLTLPLPLTLTLPLPLTLGAPLTSGSYRVAHLRTGIEGDVRIWTPLEL